MKQPSRDRTLGRHSVNAVVLKARFWGAPTGHAASRHSMDPSERGSNFARIAKSELRPAFFLTQQQVDRVILHWRRPTLGTKCVRAVSRLLFMASLLAGTGGSNGYRLYFSFNRAIASVPSSGGSAAVFLRRGWTARIYLRRRRRCLKRDTCYAPRRLEAGQGRGCHWISA